MAKKVLGIERRKELSDKISYIQDNTKLSNDNIAELLGYYDWASMNRILRGKMGAGSSFKIALEYLYDSVANKHLFNLLPEFALIKSNKEHILLQRLYFPRFIAVIADDIYLAEYNLDRYFYHKEQALIILTWYETAPAEIKKEAINNAIDFLKIKS